MSDARASEPAADGPAPSAGALLRQARQARGLHIAALAAAIKVAPRKLELLESDRFDELPDATFTRALAQTVCRTLKIDSAPVLALLPLPKDLGLAQISVGLNAPFRDRPGRRVPGELPFLKSPVVVAAVSLMILAAVLYLLPSDWIGAGRADEAAASASAESPAPDESQAPSELNIAPVEEPSEVAATPSPTPPGESMPASATGAAPEAGAALLLRTTAESWVEVIDGRGVVVLSRLIHPGESVNLDGTSPLRVKIGNAAATTVSFRGQPIDLAPSRDNVARLELR